MQNPSWSIGSAGISASETVFVDESSGYRSSIGNALSASCVFARSSQPEALKAHRDLCHPRLPDDGSTRSFRPFGPGCHCVYADVPLSFQLPPTVICPEAEVGGLGTSLFARLMHAGLKPILLDRSVLSGLRACEAMFSLSADEERG